MSPRKLVVLAAVTATLLLLRVRRNPAPATPAGSWRPVDPVR